MQYQVKRNARQLPRFKINLGLVNLTIDASWLLIAPLAAWAVAEIYIPVMGTALSGLRVWVVSVIIVIFSLLCLFVHVLAHAGTARTLRRPIPESIPVFLLADPSQAWPSAAGPMREFIEALAGPLAQLLLAGAAYFVWNLQLNFYVNFIAFFLIFFNIGVAAFNLTPAFPLDGGRLLRSIISGLLRRPDRGDRLANWSGNGLIAVLVIWGILLIVQRARLIWQAGAISFALAGLVLLSLVLCRARRPDTPAEDKEPHRKAGVLRWSAALLLILTLSLVTLGLLPLNEGLQAPGFTASVEPMVHLPQQYRHPVSDNLILTSVIPQAPILVGEWAYAHVDKSVELLPEVDIFPPSQTIQSQSQQGYQMLLSSQTTAIIVGLQLAGYQVVANSDGVVIDSILPESPASGILMPGDIITQLNGRPVGSTDDLANQLKLLSQGAVLQVSVERNGQTMELNVPTMSPSEPGGPVQIGITVETHVTGYTLPFPVEIVQDKIVGGPSAGLMFTLAIYSLLNPAGLNGGWNIAGTGTIDLDGNVGPIGGVQQKVVAAERAGAQYFLVPSANYQDALSAASNIKVVEIDTAQEAIDFLKSLPAKNTG
jgi:PDZ domain-containing protein